MFVYHNVIHRNLFIKTHSYSPSAWLSGERQPLGHDNFCCVLSRKLYVLQITFGAGRRREGRSSCFRGAAESVRQVFHLLPPFCLPWQAYVQPQLTRSLWPLECCPRGFSLPQICCSVPWCSQCSLGNYFRSGSSPGARLGVGGWWTRVSGAQMQESTRVIPANNTSGNDRWLSG